MGFISIRFRAYTYANQTLMGVMALKWQFVSSRRNWLRVDLGVS